jgi:hypothetical protein
VPGTCTGESNLDLVPYPDAPTGAVDAYITEIKAPHLSMISDPGAVTKVILEAVQATT